MKKTSKRILTISLTWSIVFLVFVGLLGGCIPSRRTPGPPTDVRPEEGYPPTMAERELLREAEQAQNQGRNKEAQAKYEEFLATFPESRLADSALVGLARAREKQGQKAQALQAYQALWKKYPRSRYADEVGRRLASLAMDNGDYDQAVQVINTLLGRTTKPEEKARLNILLGRAQLGQGQRQAAIDLFRQALSGTTDGADQEQARKGMRAAIEAMSLAELSRAQKTIGQEYPAPYLSYVLAYRLFEQGKKEEARTELNSFVAKYANHPQIGDVRALLQAIDGKGQPPKLIPTDFGTTPKPGQKTTEPPIAETPLVPGAPTPDYQSMDLALILPLSGGQGSEFGLKVKKGAELALKNYSPQTPNFKANLITLDTQGDAVKAKEMVAQTAGQSNVLAAIGPLLSREAAESAPKAQELGLPLITVTQKTGIPEIGPYIFRLFLTPQVQVSAVARYAIQDLSLTRLAILYPNDTYGQTMRDYFKEEVGRLGGRIVSIEGYDPKATDFSSQIERLTGVGKADRKIGAGRKAQVSFDAVFIPDSVKAVAMIAPQFAYHDVTSVRLLGTALWHTPQLIESAGRYTQKAIIPTAFYGGSESPPVKSFIQAFRDLEKDPKVEPTQFEAYGYDAVTLILTLMDRQHINTRDGLIKVMRNMSPFQGVTGLFSFDDHGEFKCQPMLLTVEESEFKPAQKTN